MDLKAKLRRLQSAGPGSRAGAPGAAPLPPEPSTPPELEAEAGGLTAERIRGGLRNLARVGPDPLRAPARHPKPPPLALEVLQTPHGPLSQRLEHLGPRCAFGAVLPAGARTVDPLTLSHLALDGALAGVDPAGMLLLDTETTGLSGGAGTLPFLVGVGYFEGERLGVHQWVLRRPGEEGPLLRALAERLAASTLLVSFNGKTFDWPLLRTRYVLNRLPIPPVPPHLDLLHCARRIYRRRLPDVRLTRLEVELLGHVRVGDVDGAEIPELYFSALRQGNLGGLAPVLEHNRHDVVALAGLLTTLTASYERPDPGADGRDLLGLALLAQRAGELERAACFGRLASTSPHADARFGALELLGRMALRARSWEQAQQLLQEAAACAPDAEREAAAHLSLAKLWEHRLKDAARALAHARRAGDAEDAASSARRLSRLTRRAPGAA